MKIIHTILFLIIFSVTGYTSASEKTTQEIFEEKFQATFKENTFTNFEPSPIAGIFQAEISNQIVYFAPNEELIIFGEIYDKNGISISEQTRREWAKNRIKDLDLSAAISIGDGDIEIIEFTDTDCPFCQRFDRWISTLEGKYTFTRKIVATPILQLHPNAAKEAVHLLCQKSEDYKATITQLLNNDIAYADMISCETGEELLLKHQELAKKLGVMATPTLILDGQIINGFNREKLIQTIENLVRTKRLTNPNFAQP